MRMRHLVILICSIFLLTAASTYAQNVGIGDPAAPFTPTQRLHLKGNFLLEGDFRPANLPGTAGQVLTSAGPNTAPAWAAPASGGLSGTTDFVARWISNTNIGIGQIMDNNVQIIAARTPALPTTDLNVFMTVRSIQPQGPQSIALMGTSTDSVGVKGLTTNSFGVWGETSSADAGVFGLTNFAGGGNFSSGVRGQVINTATNNQIGHGVLGLGFRNMARLNTLNFTGAANSEFNASGVTGWYEGNGTGHGVQSVAFTDSAGAIGMYSLLLPGDDFFATGTLRPSTLGARSDNWLGFGSAFLGTTSFLGTLDKNNPTIPGVSTVRGNNLMMSTASAGIEGFAVNTGDAVTTGNAALQGPGLTDPTIQGRTFGVLGASNSKGRNSAGVYGVARYTGGEKNYGVYGVAYSSADSTAGVFGTDSDNLITRRDLVTNTPLGPSTSAYGVIGKSINNVGVLGIHQSLAGDKPASFGLTYSRDGFATGVFGFAAAATGNTGPTFGIWGSSDGAFEGTAGILGTVEVAGNATIRHGVYGYSNETFAGSAGVYGDSPIPGAGQTYGVLGTSRSEAANSSGVRGVSTNPTATNPTYGVYGFTNGTNANSAGVYGSSANIVNTWAGWFEGGLRVTGRLEAGAPKNFIIDHPLDPANKYLRHSCIEAPEALNMYTGIAKTNASGLVVVKLPDYFEAINKDFRYQLTCINDFAQAIVVQKVQNNQFVIRTDKPNMEVSWTVTATRNDPAYNMLQGPTEEMKEPHNRGKYIMPEAFNQPRSAAIGYVEQSGVELVNKRLPAAPQDRFGRDRKEVPPVKYDIDYTKLLDERANTQGVGSQSSQESIKVVVPASVDADAVKQMKFQPNK